MNNPGEITLVLLPQAATLLRIDTLVHHGNGLTPLLVYVLGEYTYERVIPAQDPFAGQDSEKDCEGIIKFQVNPGARLPYFVDLGVVFRRREGK